MKIYSELNVPWLISLPIACILVIGSIGSLLFSVEIKNEKNEWIKRHIPVTSLISTLVIQIIIQLLILKTILPERFPEERPQGLEFIVYLFALFSLFIFALVISIAIAELMDMGGKTKSFILREIYSCQQLGCGLLFLLIITGNLLMWLFHHFQWVSPGVAAEITLQAGFILVSIDFYLLNLDPH